jgi:hypothetical protein
MVLFAGVLVDAALARTRYRRLDRRQLLCTEQSPQPSQTSSLMTPRLAGSTIVPRFLRGFSVAQSGGR